MDGKNMVLKPIILPQKNSKIIHGFQKQSQNKKSSKRPQGPTRKLYTDKSWGKQLYFVSYRSQVAQSGGNWLKLAKTASQVYKFPSFFDAIYVRCLRGSVGQLLPLDPKVRGSNPVNCRFFFCFSNVWGVMGSIPA